MVRILKLSIFLSFSLVLNSCVRSYITSEGGFWPKKTNFSLEKHKHENIKGIIKTNVVYQLYAEFIGEDNFELKEKKHYTISKNREGNNAKSFIRFYENGNMSSFDIQKDSVLKRKHLNPKRGRIGVYNIKNNEFIIEQFVSRFTNTTYYKRKAKVYNDTLHLIYNSGSSSNASHKIYIKQNVPQEFLNWEANW